MGALLLSFARSGAALTAETSALVQNRVLGLCLVTQREVGWDCLMLVTVGMVMSLAGFVGPSPFKGWD